MISIIKAFQCDYCNMIFDTRTEAEAHVKYRCESNPKRRACGTCGHLMPRGIHKSPLCDQKNCIQRATETDCTLWGPRE
jgi:hypothetical protein